jgi:hypothetical protein
MNGKFIYGKKGHLGHTQPHNGDLQTSFIFIYEMYSFQKIVSSGFEMFFMV